MKQRTKLIVLIVGLASLWCGIGPTKAQSPQWTYTATPASGYPVENEGGGGGGTSFLPSPPGVESDENSSASGPYAHDSPNYEIRGTINYTWQGIGPPDALTIKFSIQATAQFSGAGIDATNGTQGSASATATTTACSLEAYSNASEDNQGTFTSPIASQTVTFQDGGFSHNFTLDASSSASATAYESGDSFSTRSSAVSQFEQQ